MLALDKTLSYIDADFADVTQVYKSVAPLTVALAGIPSEVCEAYICVIRKNDLLRVHAGLATGGNRLFIYSPEKQPGTDAALAGALKEAKTFIEAMGFRMEELNLNYSSAMRDVVMRDIKVLRPPRMAPKPTVKKAPPVITKKQGKVPAAAPTLDKISMRESSARQDLGQETPALTPAPAPPAVDTEELANLRGELVRLTTERAVAERAASTLLAATREELEQMRAARDGLTESLGTREAATAGLAADLANLKAEMSAAKKEQEKAHRELRDRLAERDEELTRLRQEYEALVKARDAVADALRKEQGTRIAAQEEARRNEARLTEELNQARLARNALDAGHGEALERLTGELEAARAELERVTAEKISAEALAKQQTELAKAAVAELTAQNDELAQIRTEKITAEEAAAQQAALARTTAAELTSVKVELDRIAGETAGKVTRELAQKQVAVTTASGLTEPTVALPVETGKEESCTNEPSAVQTEPAQPAAVEAEQPAAVEAEQPAAVEAEQPAVVEAEHPAAVEPAHVEKEPSGQPAIEEFPVAAAGEAASCTAEATPATTAEKGPDAPATLLRDELESLRAAQAASEKMLRDLAALQQRTLEELATAKQALNQAPPGTDPHLPPVRTEAAPAGTASEPGPRFAALMTASPPTQSSGGAQIDGVGNIFGSARSSTQAADPLPRPGSPIARAPIEFPPDDDATFFGSDSHSPGLSQAELEDYRFVLQPGLEQVQYGTAAELVALYQSINVVRLVQGGESPQGSKGFVCAVKCGDGFRVYAAIFLLERERAFIYAPQIQPQGAGMLETAIHSGLDFAEMTGFMMDETDLSMEPDRLARILAKIPVLKQQNAP